MDLGVTDPVGGHLHQKAASGRTAVCRADPEAVVVWEGRANLPGQRPTVQARLVADGCLRYLSIQLSSSVMREMRFSGFPERESS